MQRHYFKVGTAAADMVPIGAVGFYIRYYKALTGVDNPSLLITTDRGDEFPLLPGQGVHLSADAGRWELRNLDRIAEISGYVIVGGLDAVLDDDRVSGEVSVIDASKSRTIGNSAYFVLASKGPVAANYSVVGLKNVSADKRIVVPRLRIGTTAAAGIYFGITTDVLATAYAFGKSKLAAGSDSTTSRSYTDATAGGVTESQRYGLASVPANTLITLKMDEPIVLPPGETTYVQHSIVNSDITCIWEVTEENNT